MVPTPSLQPTHHPPSPLPLIINPIPILNPRAEPFQPTLSVSPPSATLPLAWSSLVGSNVSSNELVFVKPVVVKGILTASCKRSEIEKFAKRWEDTLFGFLLGKKPHLPSLRKYLLSKWGLKCSLELTFQADGAFTLRFGSAEERIRILESGPWFIGGRLLVLKIWRRGLKRSDFNLSVVPVWVRLPNLPLEFWSPDSLSRIGSVLGKPLFADEATTKQSRTSFARLCVEVEISTNFPKQVSVDIDGSEGFLQDVIFEWKPTACKVCASFLHGSSFCDKASVSKVAKLDATVLENPKNGWTVVNRKQWRRKCLNPIGNGVQELPLAPFVAARGGNVVEVSPCDPQITTIEVPGGESGDMEPENGRKTNGLTDTGDSVLVLSQISPENGRDDCLGGSSKCTPTDLTETNQLREIVGLLEDDPFFTGVVEVQAPLDEPSEPTPVIIDISTQSSEISLPLDKPLPILPCPFTSTGPKPSNPNLFEPNPRQTIPLQTLPTTKPPSAQISPLTNSDLVHPNPHPIPTNAISDPSLTLIQTTPITKPITSSSQNNRPTQDPLGSNPNPNPTLSLANPCADSTPRTPVTYYPSQDTSPGDSSEDSDSSYPPGFTPTQEDVAELRELMKEGVGLVPFEHQKGFIESVDHAGDEDILDFFKEKFKEADKPFDEPNFVTHRGIRCSPRLKKKPAKSTDQPRVSGLKKGFIK